MSAHITVVTKRVSRRSWLMGADGQRRQLCGAAPTDRDIQLRDARKMTGIQAKEWNVCEACVREAQRLEVAR